MGWKRTDSFSTTYPKKLWRLSLLAIDQWGDLGSNGRKVYKKMLPDFPGCCNWKLTMQNRSVKKKKLWEVTLQAGVP
jgi:hypothetical protein